MSHPSHRQVKSPERTHLPAMKLGLMILDVDIYMRLPGVELSLKLSLLLGMALARRSEVYSDSPIPVSLVESHPELGIRG